MLLCCFREPKEAKRRPSSSKDSSPAYVGKKALNSSTTRPLATPINDEILVVHQHPRQSVTSLSSNESKRNNLERAPLPKEAKRLLKQRSQDSFKDGNNKSVTSIPYIDASPPSVSSNGCYGKSITPTHHSSKAAASCWSPPPPPGAPPGATSTPNLPTSTPVHGVYSPGIRPSVAKITSETSLSSSSNLLNGSSNQLSKAEEKIQGRGMCRSNASYGIQKLLQEQISKEEKEQQAKVIEREVKAAVAKVTASYEERLSSARAEHSLKIQQILRDKTTAVNNARNTFESELKRQLATFEKDLHEMKSQHNTDRQNSEMAFNAKLRDDEEKHQQIIDHYQQRDEAWQAEKEEVLAEIQRLKAEANRFITILSQEDDPEKANEMLSPAKRQSLTREVESLQLVVEMRTSELHKLREERTRHLQQLDELQRTKALLEKANARVEDLTVQLAAKTELESYVATPSSASMTPQLSWEKSQLENFFETETKNKTRISMQVEELQWRIKHNKELPPPQVFSPTTSPSTDNSPQFVTTSSSNGSSTSTHHQQWPQQMPTIVMNNGTKLNENLLKNNSSPVKKLMPRPNNIDGIQPRQLELPQKNPVRSSSEDSLETEHDINANNGNAIKEDNEKNSDEEDEAGLSDEGLGDITSEASNSPQPPPASSATSSTKANNNVEEAFSNHKRLVKCDNNLLEEASEVVTGKANNNYSLPTSPSDERVPSRIPFPKKQHKSQTNL